MKYLISLCMLVMLSGIVLAGRQSEICADLLISCDDQFIQSILNDDSLLAGKSRVITTPSSYIIFIYRSEHQTTSRVWMCCGIQGYLRLVADDIWAHSLYVENLDQAIIGYSFIEYQDQQPLSSTEYQLWRGENAPEAPPQANPLNGMIEDVTIYSHALTQERGLSIYLPPTYSDDGHYPVVYVADGRSVHGFASYIEPLIQNEQIAPILIVGVHASDYRAEEYVPGWDAERFATHEIFFTQEVRTYAETLGASTNPSERAVGGYSNGGVFALTMALRHPDIYGIAFPFSVAGTSPFDVFPALQINPAARYYFTAGTIETDIYTRTERTAQRIASSGADVIWQSRVAGHDFFMWFEEYTYAVAWAFG